MFDLFPANCWAQKEIRGTIKTPNGKVLENASIVSYDTDGNIISYTYSKTDGSYHLIIKNISSGNIILVVASLGFSENRTDIQLIEEKDIYYNCFVLQEKAEQLKEVVLESTAKISANNGVTTYQVKAFNDNTEQTVEDVLRNLPGIEVMPDGSIKAHGKFIEKLLIEGEDMFDANYKVLSKNLDAKVLDAIQILDNFEPNPILADVLESDRVALNLLVKDELKNIWFGNISVGLGTEERKRVTANVGLIRKKIKFFYFGDYTNLGMKAADQIGVSNSEIHLNSTYNEKRFEPEIQPVYSIDKNENGVFNEGQSTFNKALLNSLSFVTNLGTNITLRGTGHFTRDQQNQDIYSETVYNISEDPIRVFENNNVHHTNTIASGELELKYTGGQKSYLKNLLVYKTNPQDFFNEILTNDQEINQKLQKKDFSIYNHFNYSYRLGQNKVLHNYVHFGRNQIDQTGTLESPTLNNLFNIPQNAQIEHFSDDALTTYGITSSLFSQYGKLQHILEIGYRSIEEKRKNLFVTQPISDRTKVDSLQNNLIYKQQELELKNSLNYEFSEHVLLKLDLSLTHFNLATESTEKKVWKFIPEIHMRFKKFDFGSFGISYANSYSLPNAINLLENYQIASYRSFLQGNDKIHLSRTDKFQLYYNLNNEMKTKAVHLNVSYHSTKKRYSTENQINQDFIFSRYQFADGGNRLLGTLNFVSFFKDLLLSTKLETTQTWTEQSIKANSNTFTSLENYFSAYSVSGTTFFKLPINFNFKIALNSSESKFNGVRSKTNWQDALLNVTYNITNEWIAEVSDHFYHRQNETYSFLGATINYTPEKSKFNYRLILNNLANEKIFATTQIDDYTSYTSQIELLPRYFFINVKYRF